MDVQSNIPRGGIHRVRPRIRWAWIVVLVIAGLAGLVGGTGTDRATIQSGQAGSSAHSDRDLPEPKLRDQQPESRDLQS